jgi:hypothetical protein
MRFPHRWTAEAVTVLGAFTGAHLLHLSIAGCVLNDLYREAAGARIDLRGVRVSAGGGFDPHTWTSSGITYSVEVVSDVPPDELTASSPPSTRWPRSPGPCGPEPRAADRLSIAPGRRPCRPGRMTLWRMRGTRLCLEHARRRARRPGRPLPMTAIGLGSWPARSAVLARRVRLHDLGHRLRGPRWPASSTQAA